MLYLLLGAVGGFFAGLLGVGGGVLLVPLLSMMYAAQQFPDEHVLHLALGTSIATILLTAASSLRAHHHRGAVLWPVVLGLTPGLLAGTLLGSVVARYVSTRGLTLFFGIFLFGIALQMLLDIKPKPSRSLPGRGGLIGAGLGIGIVSALAAIGGGAMTVPFLSWCNVQMREAIGTSAAVGLPVAIGGTIGYIANGLTVSGLPAGSLGFVYLPAWIWVVAASTACAPLGAAAAHKLPVKTLKRVFACLLVVLAANMLWRLR